MTANTQTERLGIAAVDKLASKSGWIFREQAVADHGIDAQIERLDSGGHADGRLIALQIKSGSSYFNTPTKDGWAYSVKSAHRDYWNRHSLPVVVVLYDPDTDVAYWQVYSSKTVFQTASGAYRIQVPREHQLRGEAFDQFTALAEAGLPSGDVEKVEALRNRRLETDLGWMEMLEGSSDLFLEIREPTAPDAEPGTLALVVEDRGRTVERHDWAWKFNSAGKQIEELQDLFPWATLSTEGDLYRRAAYLEFLAQHATWDAEDGTYAFDEASDDLHAFEDWADRHWSQDLIRPYAHSADGSLALWRLRLRLNDVGRAAVSDYHSEILREINEEIYGEDDDLWARSASAYVGTIEEAGYVKDVFVIGFEPDDEYRGLPECLAIGDDVWDNAGLPILTHALGQAPWQELVTAFNASFHNQIHESETGDWAISYQVVSDWLDASKPISSVWRRRSQRS